ncbi:uncharacterized protein [Littorina saxatilis]|uniref:Uncharacterized protein n=1 Tax=Littorina saxatilis TaxID=31220 RepID=A0AAN9C4Z3_9CAEN
MQVQPETNGGGEASWKDSYKTAQMITLPDVTHVCGSQAGQLVRDLARGTGCPEEFILTPLLSCCSALMGHRSEICVHGGWSEPPVLWFLVGAGEGTRKSAALRQVLSPLLALADDMRQKEKRKLEQCGNEEDMKEKGAATRELDLPLVYTGSIAMPQLRNVLHESEGHVLHVTERLEDAHRQLGMHALNVEKGTRERLHDLYEAFAGNFALPPPPTNSAGTTRIGSSVLSPVVFYNQCGFASPQYVVTMAVKAPSWLSGRFLVSCPSLEENTTAVFSLPNDDDDDNGSTNDDTTPPPKAKKAKTGHKPRKLSLKDVYLNLSRAHSFPRRRRYVFSKEAVRELRRFQEEEWQTIVNQLGGKDNGGAVEKSLGQIIRLAGVLKALKDAAELDFSSSSKLTDADDASEDQETEGKIDRDDVSGAIELGKYFLEQKLSMTFMVSTGFFRRSGNSSGTPVQESHASRPPSSSSAPQNSQNSDYSYMPPPPDPANSLYGFAKVAGGFLPQTAVSGAVTSSPHQHHPYHHSHPHQASPTVTSLASSQTAPFSFNFTGGGAPVSMPGPRSYHFPMPTINHSQPTPSASPAASHSSSHAPPPEIDVAQLPATWIPTTPEEELAEMSQAAEFVQLEPTQFVAVHARRVKRLLECFDDGCGVSATTAAQKSIAPPVRVAGTNNRHPAWASALFFQKVADLGLGVAEQVRHPTNGRVYWRFKRKSVPNLSEKNFQLLHYLRIDMVRYSQMGQPTLHVPGVDIDIPTPGSVSAEHSLLDGEGSNSSGGKGDNSPFECEIKQEIL